MSLLSRGRSVVDTIRFIHRHPLASRNRPAAFSRWLRWQLGSRLLPGESVVELVGGAHLLVRPGMTGATGNIYTGLHEFEDMAFMLHFLRPGDLFVDVGANIGSYSILAAVVAKSRVRAFEPVPGTFERLVANVRLNDVGAQVNARREGVGAHVGELEFTTQLDTINHVVRPCDGATNVIAVPVVPLDQALGADELALLKIDVEGFELEVLHGAPNTLQRVPAVILELNDMSESYGYSPETTHSTITGYGFKACRYDPFARTLSEIEGGTRNLGSLNTIYVRDLEGARSRLAIAPKLNWLGVDF